MRAAIESVAEYWFSYERSVRHCRSGFRCRHCGDFGACDLASLIVDAATECVAANNEAANSLLRIAIREASLALWLSMGEAQMVGLLARARAVGYLDLYDNPAPTATGWRELHLYGGPIKWRGRSCFLVMAHEITCPESLGPAPPRSPYRIA